MFITRNKSHCSCKRQGEQVTDFNAMDLFACGFKAKDKIIRIIWDYLYNYKRVVGETPTTLLCCGMVKEDLLTEQHCGQR